MRVGIATDHGGFGLKEELIARMRAAGYEIVDFGAHCLDPSDDRLEGIFVRDASGRRPVYGGTKKFQEDPHWRDLVLFYEYFHGDNGAGLGASHQTGWTGTIAFGMDFFRKTPSGPTAIVSCSRTAMHRCCFGLCFILPGSRQSTRIMRIWAVPA